MYKISEEHLKAIKELLDYVQTGNKITIEMSKEADRLIAILKEEYYV